MAIVVVTHIRRRSGNREERTEVHGYVDAARRVAIPAGTFQLRTLTSITYGQAHTAQRSVQGSVTTPNVQANSATFIGRMTGTTGTRLASIAAIGSVPAAATPGTVRVEFTAYGY